MRNSDTMQPRRTVDWSKDPTLLQKKIYQIIAAISTPTHIPRLLDQTAMEKYWAPAFTHKSVDASSNYETFEFYGDKVMNYVFSVYIRNIFGERINQARGTLLMNRYMSEDFQAKIAEYLGLVEYIRYDASDPRISDSVKEDVVEAFFGCLCIIANERIDPPNFFGYPYCYSLLAKIMDAVTISLDKIQKDPITQLKELFEKLEWGTPKYDQEMSDRPDYAYKVTVRSEKTGEALGVGYGNLDRAKEEAATEALKMLEAKGYNLEAVEREKTSRKEVRNLEFEKQYNRVREAVKMAGYIDFNVRQERVLTYGGKTRYVYVLEGKKQDKDGTIKWHQLDKKVGENSEETKIAILKGFADLYS